MTSEIPAAWQPLLGDQTTQPYWAELHRFLADEAAQGKQIYPPASQRYAALEAVPPEAVKVVILGQDPYHGPGQAHGLSFSVPAGIKPPPSLKNIFKEIARDFGHTPPQHGDLSAWAQQGVLLLNSVLSVESSLAGAHRKRGWERFTDVLVSRLAQQQQAIVFMLWGAYAEAKAELIDAEQHCILRSVHPSPLSAHRGFLGNGHFSAANHYLQRQGRSPIDWSLN